MGELTRSDEQEELVAITVNSCAFSPSGGILAAGDVGGNVYILELISFECEHV